MKKLSKVALFILLCVVVFLTANRIFKEKFVTDNRQTYMADTLYELPEDSVEVAVCGSSQIAFGISGMELYEKYGISAYSTGSPNQSILCSLGWLRELDKRQDIKVCLLDVSQMTEINRESFYRQAIDPMRLSWNKIDIVRRHLAEDEDADSLFSYLCPLVKYHARWEELTRTDFRYTVEDSPLYRGNFPTDYNYSFTDYNALMKTEPGETDETLLEEQSVEALRLIQAYCDENDIALVLFKTPKEDWTESYQSQMKELAEEMNLPLLDYAAAEGCRELGLDFYTDFKDPQHLNLRGADKLSDALGAYLTEHYDLTDFRETGPMDDAVLEKYHAVKREAYFKTESDVVSYLNQMREDYLSTGEYDLILQLTDDAVCSLWTDEMQDAFASCGLQTDIASLEGKTYAAYITGGKTVEKTGGARELVLTGTMTNGGTLEAVSAPKENRQKDAEIKAGGTSGNYTGFGLNLLLYDNTQNVIAEECTIARCPDGVLRANFVPDR